MHLSFNNVNDAFHDLVVKFRDWKTFKYPPFLSTTSRVGDVIQIAEPVTITYKNPRQRVLFNEARDANPFFHLMEALWMLAGRRDIEPMAYYAANYRECVQDGDNPNANGAYGYRWRHAPAYWGLGREALGAQDGTLDQLHVVIDQLKRKPDSRRVVLQMWNVGDDLQQIDKTKDVCCNTHAYFLINGGKLDMTVCNRSNDLIWGALGANVVHFSFLQEYLAANIGVEVGVYNQFTNNLHVYTSRFEPDKWLSDSTPNRYQDHHYLVPLVKNPTTFEKELQEFNTFCLAKPELGKAQFDEPFFSVVACPAQLAFADHKRRDYKAAVGYASEIEATDWRAACTSWLRRRQASYERAADDGVGYTTEGDNRNPYLENELQRLKGDKDVSSISEEK